MADPMTVRQACRARMPLDGADAQALEHALTITERERDEARAEVERLRANVRAAIVRVCDARSSWRDWPIDVGGTECAYAAEVLRGELLAAIDPLPAPRPPADGPQPLEASPEPGGAGDAARALREEP